MVTSGVLFSVYEDLILPLFMILIYVLWSQFLSVSCLLACLATALAVLQNVIKWLEVIATKGKKTSTIHPEIKHYNNSSQIG